MMHFTRRAIVVATMTISSVAVGQSYNIDFGSESSLPASTYSAAGLAGTWNSIGVPTPGVHYPLLDLQGSAAGVTLNNIGGTQLLITDDPATSADDGALMDDMLIGFNNPVDVCIWINNLPNGPYEILIYAMTPNDPALLSRTRVDFADQGPTMVGGAWPGQHELHVTYSRHTVMVFDGQIGLHSGLFGGNVQSGINGIQIRPLVPGDLNGDGLIGVFDLLILLGDWGECPKANDCLSDLDGDGVINVSDLLILLGHWD